MFLNRQSQHALILYLLTSNHLLYETFIFYAFSVAFEQLFLMQEIEKFHPFDPLLTSGLEKWLLLHCKGAFYDNAEITKNTNHMTVDNIIREQGYREYFDKRNGSIDATTEHKIYGNARNKKGR